MPQPSRAPVLKAFSQSMPNVQFAASGNTLDPLA